METASSAWSCSGASARQEAERFTDRQEDSAVSAGFLWHTLERSSKELSLSSSITSFVLVHANLEVHLITLTNIGELPREFSVLPAFPIYGRSADNIRDHRNVTSMLHRIRVTENGVEVCPSMSFDEKGHRLNGKIYYCLGFTGSGAAPDEFFPTVEAFIGEGGSLTSPRAVLEHRSGKPSGFSTGGREAIGAFRFQQTVLMPRESRNYIVLSGIAETEAEIQKLSQSLDSCEKVEKALEETKAYWASKVNIRFYTGQKSDLLLPWISFQPTLRRLFGCSFLPHHDYGRGGRGWRDLWQDCLSLLLMDPSQVGGMIRKNFGGVRIDGTNATIIGQGDGNFIADRNGIARVWMDHAVWPLLTTRLYIDQTGDLDILLEEAPYFRDQMILRGDGLDSAFDPEAGSWLRVYSGALYQGSILEHLLGENLTAFYDVGEHGICRLHGADWNDALDMAAERGESTAFTFAYAGNLTDLASLCAQLERKVPSVSLPEELCLLLEDSSSYGSPEKKRQLLRAYLEKVRGDLSGERRECLLSTLAQKLLDMAASLREMLRKEEWIQVGDLGWYNSYYDNSGRRVEGIFDDQVRMMLTGQVFAIMSDTASEDQIRQITEAADRCLYREEIGGYRLNTDFHELKLDMGRMFGFYYGEKENGAVFSHMAVMYANALYRRGFAKEGWKALKALLSASLNFEKSRIYPGIPEYFRPDGRAVYHYLTGAASWFLLTMVTEVFGVRGIAGDLCICPKLLSEQFDAAGRAEITLPFRGKSFHVSFENPERKDCTESLILSASLDGAPLEIQARASVLLPREMLDSLDESLHQIRLTLG